MFGPSGASPTSRGSCKEFRGLDAALSDIWLPGPWEVPHSQYFCRVLAVAPEGPELPNHSNSKELSVFLVKKICVAHYRA